MAEPELRVVHLDEWLAVVDKPAGLVVHPAPVPHRPDPGRRAGRDPRRRRRTRSGRGSSTGSTRAPAACWSSPATTRPTRRCRSRCASARSSGSTWRWPAAGCASRTGTIDAPIGRAARQRHRMAVSGAASRQARTHFTVLELLPRETYLEARLETGRTHQIRAHFAAIGHPLTGDITYGGALRYGLERQFLHAHRLAFQHPQQRRAAQLHLAAAGRPGRGAGGGPRRVAAAPLQSSVQTNPRSKRARILPGHHQVPASGAGRCTQI